jgi:ribose transport system ATP-binding protein
VVREGRIVHTGPAAELDEHRVLDLVMEGADVVADGRPTEVQ